MSITLGMRRFMRRLGWKTLGNGGVVVDEEAKTEADNWQAMTVGLKTSAKRKSGAMHSRGFSKRRGLEHR
jgi:hypothetical protein